MPTQQSTNEPSSSSVINITDLVDFHANQPKTNWEQFNDDDGDEEVVNKPDFTTNRKIHESYAEEFNKDLDRIEQIENNITNFPKPIYEGHVNNNTTYSFDSNETVGNASQIFAPLPTGGNSYSQEILAILKKPTIYKSLVQIITTRYSIFIFFALFPSYLYNKVKYIKSHHTTFVVGAVAISGLLFVSINIWLSNNSKKRPVFLAALSWLGSLGYLSKYRINYDVRSLKRFSTFSYCGRSK